MKTLLLLFLASATIASADYAVVARGSQFYTTDNVMLTIRPGDCLAWEGPNDTGIQIYCTAAGHRLTFPFNMVTRLAATPANAALYDATMKRLDADYLAVKAQRAADEAADIAAAKAARDRHDALRATRALEDIADSLRRR